MKPLLLFCPWFGPWPEWIEFFVESCKWNPEVDWLIHTDQEPPENAAPNVEFSRISFSDYKRLLAERLGVDTSGATPYKICDYKPAYAYVFKDKLAGYRFFGYCDLDVVFGDIRAFFDDDLLSQYDAISAAPDRIAGHLSVFRNTPRSRNRFKGIRRWRRILAAPDYVGMDEHHFTSLFRPGRWRMIRRALAPDTLFADLAATPGGRLVMPDGSPIPQHWEWREGKLRHAKRPDGTVYLHMMFWQSGRWHGPGMDAPWPNLPAVVQCDWREAALRGFSISPKGIGLTK